ncbi:hypothetical protein [Lactococcus sp.]|uniref:hypothetical protein n=1 Tax=Lactococcus sp. TaxID=44273 RepID=UPI002FC6C830
MIENLEFLNNVVSWEYKGDSVQKKLNNIIFVSEDSTNGYIKIETGENFVTDLVYYFSYTGKILLEYNLKTGEIIWEKGKKERRAKLYNLENVSYFPQKNMTLAIYGENTDIQVYDKDGNIVIAFKAPKYFKLEYFQEFSNYVTVVGTGSMDQADKYGRTSYNFKLNFEDDILEKIDISY